MSSPQSDSISTAHRRLSCTLMRLATATALLAAPAAHGRFASLSQTSDLLQNLAHTVTSTTVAAPKAATASIQMQADEAVAMIEAMMMMSVNPCGEPGRVYLDGPNGELLSSVWLHIAGPDGAQWFSLASGTNLYYLATAINSMTGALGVHASIVNPHRVELASSALGMNQFVRVRQSTGQHPIIFSQDAGGEGVFLWTDYGCSFGMPLCADPGAVFLSTNANLEFQGKGALQLVIRGNFGVQQFTFASGTAQADLVAAINTFESQTGVIASVSRENADRVKFTSLLVGSESFVRVRYEGYAAVLLATSPFGAVHSSNVMDRGRSVLLGDANCDWRMNQIDLALMLQAWGECQPTPMPCPADFDYSGAVNVDDLIILLRWWTGP